MTAQANLPDAREYFYGVYLFAFPQTLVYVLPASRHWFINAPLALALATLYAMFSWWFVEKPILDQEKAIVQAVEASMARCGGFSSPTPKVKLLAPIGE